MKICMIGLGYIGLPTATLFASKKVEVVGVDVSETVVDIINQGKIHIVEPELDILVHSAVTSGFLKASTVPEAADAFLIAVPTPFNSDKSADLSYVEAATKSIARFVKPGNVIILESTSPVGTTEKVLEIMNTIRPDLSCTGEDDGARIYIAYCPERVLPGKVIHELVSNDRIIGGIDEESSIKAANVYKIFVEGDCLITNSRTAELCKLTENSFRDVNIAFANELSLICSELNVNVWDLIRLANKHPRVNILQPGPGVGGHCIAVDPWFIVESVPKYSKLIKTARDVNDYKPEWVIEKVKSEIKKFSEANNSTPKIAVFGLTFKANIDDLRESPALDIALQIAKLTTATYIVEPNVSKLPNAFDSTGAVLYSDIDSAIVKSDIKVILVSHNQFIHFKSAISESAHVIDTVGFLS